eukprot:gene4029-14108_t
MESAMELMVAVLVVVDYMLAESAESDSHQYLPQLTTRNMGIDWDKTLLVSSGVTSIGYGVPGLVTPTPMAKAFYTDEKNTSFDEETGRYFGLGYLAHGALTLGLASDEVKPETKKTAMKTLGGCWLGAAALNAANLVNKKQRLEVGVANAVWQTGLGSAMLYRGFKND